MRAHLIRFGFLAVLLASLAPGTAAAQEPAAPPSADGVDEGVAVHGHWTITVRRDGELVDRWEFENALANGGQRQFSELLTRQVTAGFWIILVQADGSGSLCANNDFVLGDDTDCAISEAAAELTVSATADHTVLLVGSDTVQRDGNLEGVHTFQHRCLESVAPTDCQTSAPNTQGQITIATLNPVIPVQNGDQIDVTVELSFN